jgi:predicted enzyme related to lactoylglutathione lyase
MQISSYPQGTPNWVDLGTPDLDATLAFYGGLFGWTSEEGPPEAGGYRMCLLNGVPVAGVGPLMSPDQPPMWTTYIATDDADATAAAVESAGGKVLMAPMDVMDVGRMGIFMDQTGAVFGAWQKGTFAGAGVANEPGAFTWNELMTRDVEGSRDFYAKVFGLGGTQSEIAGDMVYIEWQVAGRRVGGMMPIDGPEWPADLPSHWMAYFAVADTDATCAKVQELGGKVSVPPTDIPVGRFAVVNDPQGATFSIIKMSSDAPQP